MESDHDTPDLDLQIVGAGLAGLLAANLAADAGLTVRLIERSAGPGGRAASADHQGYGLNVGPHALYLQGELRRCLVGLGLDPPGAPPETAGGTGTIGSRIGLLPLGPTSLLRTSLLSSGAKWDVARFFSRTPRLDPTTLASVATDDWIAGFTDRADARALIQGVINLSTYNPAAELASADAVVAQLQMALDEGVRYVNRGWGSIVEWLSARASGHGVALVTATARRVVPGPSVTTVVTDDGTRLAARACIVASGGPAVADRLLGLDGHHVDRAGPAVEASVLDLGLRHRPAVGAHLGLDRGLYATVHSMADGLASTGRHLVSLARYRRLGDDTDPDRTRELLMDHGRTMGIDPDDIEMDRYLHRLTVANGMPLAERGGLAGRPTVAVDGRPGVYVAGDWVGPRGLLADASAASAVDAVDTAFDVLTSGGLPVSGADRRVGLGRP